MELIEAFNKHLYQYPNWTITIKEVEAEIGRWHGQYQACDPCELTHLSLDKMAGI